MNSSYMESKQELEISIKREQYVAFWVNTVTILNRAAAQKRKIVFCDEKKNPQSQLMPLYGSHDTSAKIRTQIQWNIDIKQGVWTKIVTEKISNHYYSTRRNTEWERPAGSITGHVHSYTSG